MKRIAKTKPEGKYEPAGKHESFWIASAPDTNYPQLSEKVSVDAAILGGGIAGITSALFLKKAGMTVAVIEANKILKGVTGHTTAHITSAHGPVYRCLNGHFGREGAQSYADANQAAIEKISQLAKENKVNCDFRRTSEYIYTETGKDLDRLRDEFKTAESLGLPVSFESSAPLPFKTYGAIQYHNQAQFHPRKYLLELAKLIPGNGSFIFEETRVLDVEEGMPCRVRTEKGELSAKNVIVATHFPILNRGMFFSRMRPYRSYVIGVRATDKMPEGMFDSAEDPSHYIRTQPTSKGPLLIIGGEDHPTGHEKNTMERYRRLEEFARKHFHVKSIDCRWSTQDNYSFDNVPFIGRLTPSSKHVYVATAFNGWGMTHGTLAGIILSDMILGRRNRFQKLYDPGRHEILTAGKELISFNLHIAEILAKDKFLKPEELSRIPAGEAGIAQINGRKAAVYRDEKGRMHAISTACTHMGCTIRWNNAEKSWDCPCHGSRFGFDGDIIHSPAVKKLKKEI